MSRLQVLRVFEIYRRKGSCMTITVWRTCFHRFGKSSVRETEILKCYFEIQIYSRVLKASPALFSYLAWHVLRYYAQAFNFFMNLPIIIFAASPQRV